MKRTSIILALLLTLALTVSGAVMAADEYAADHELKVTIPENIYIELSVSEEDIIDFGTIYAGDTYQANDSVTLTYRCNKKTDWVLTASAGKFCTVEGEELPVNKLNIVIDGSRSNILENAVDIDNNTNPDPAKEKSIDIGYELYISSQNFEEAFAGDYTSVVTYTLFVQ